MTNLISAELLAPHDVYVPGASYLLLVVLTQLVTLEFYSLQTDIINSCPKDYPRLGNRAIFYVYSSEGNTFTFGVVVPEWLREGIGNPM